MTLEGQEARGIPARRRVDATEERGYAMAALLVGLSVMAVMVTVVMPVWKQMTQRDKEEELIFRGEQYARAIGLFQRKFASAFPPNADVLVDQHFLRKKYKDPITGDDFQILTQASLAPGTGSQTASQPGAATGRGTSAGPGTTGFGSLSNAPPGGPSPATPGGAGIGVTAGAVGGMIGVASKSKAESIRIYNGRTHYNEWRFVFVPQTQAPGAAAPGQARPGPPGLGGAPPGAPGQPTRPNTPPGGRGFSPTLPPPR